MSTQTKAQHTRKLLDDLVDAEVRDGLYDRVPKPQPDWSTVGPELLEALKIAVREIDVHNCAYHYTTERSVLDKLSAAIARAEGRE